MITSRRELSRTIEVFVSNQEVITGHFKTVEFSTPGHPCTAKPIIAPILESVLPKNHLQIIEMIKKVAREHGFKIKIYNTSSRLGKIKAFLKGVKKTPTVIINNQKVTGKITEEKLLSLLL
jgi:hypothetical protein